jgi:hypothetical protein
LDEEAIWQDISTSASIVTNIAFGWIAYKTLRSRQKLEARAGSTGGSTGTTGRKHGDFKYKTY